MTIKSSSLVSDFFSTNSMNSRLSPLHAPLGLPLGDEVPTKYIKIEGSDLERKLFNPQPVGLLSSPKKSSAPNVISHRLFDPMDEEMRVRMCQSANSLLEPVECLLEALSSGDPEKLKYVPSILDFYPNELRAVTGNHEVASAVASDNINIPDLGVDSLYSVVRAADLSMEADESAPVDSGVSTPLVSSMVAHSPVAYDLSGAVPWANYTGDWYSPISPMEIRYHRVGICSLNFDRPGVSVWSVLPPKNGPPLEIPPDGSCPFRTSLHLSLADKQSKFVLIEWTEQFPLLMHFHGMSASVLNYFSRNHPKQTFGANVSLSSEFLPRAFGGNTIQFGTGDTCTVMESSLLRAPLFSHKPNPTDFLLVRPMRSGRANKGAANMFYLQAIQTVFVAGQAEPLYRVDVPVVPRLHHVLSTRVMIEGRRFWLRAKTVPPFEFLQQFFTERRSLLNRYYADVVRDIQQRPSAPLVCGVTPEEAAVVCAMKEGVRRLAERGIERIVAISPMRIRNYVRDIEVFERSMPLSSRTPRIRNLCIQLENEMRQSSWNLSNDFWDVMTGKRGAMFQFSPLGDPSGGRGEGISFRKIIKVDGASAASALGAISGARKEGPGIEDIRSRTKKELVAELVKLNVPDRVWKTMSRWQLMRQLILLLGIEDDTEERLAPWKRKALHTERINDAWKKQARALSDPEPPRASKDEMKRGTEAYGFTGSSRDDREEPSPLDSGASDDEGAASLEAEMLADLQHEEMVDAEADELHKFRTRETTAVVPMAGPQITRLQIVSTGRVKSTGNPWSKVTYVYGEKNMALYRKWKELEDDQADTTPAEETSTGTPHWHAKVEMSLKVHRRYQRILKQAAEAGRPIPDIKRCSACHLFGHDVSYEGCPILVNELEQSATVVKRKRNIEQSPIYD